MGDPTSTSDNTQEPGVCAINCNNDHNFYSFHTGGSNFGLCDGSVRFVNERTSVVIVDMLTKAYGESTNLE